MTMAEIVYELNKHLKRMASDPAINQSTDGYIPFFFPGADRAGNRISIRYISYQCSHIVTKAQAQAYLDWLNAGNNGRHYEALREEK